MSAACAPTSSFRASRDSPRRSTTPSLRVWWVPAQRTRRGAAAENGRPPCLLLYLLYHMLPPSRTLLSLSHISYESGSPPSVGLGTADRRPGWRAVRACCAPDQVPAPPLEGRPC